MTPLYIKRSSLASNKKAKNRTTEIRTRSYRTIDRSDFSVIRISDVRISDDDCKLNFVRIIKKSRGVSLEFTEYILQRFVCLLDYQI